MGSVSGMGGVGGRGEIRTHGSISGSPLFESGAINRALPPVLGLVLLFWRIEQDLNLRDLCGVRSLSKRVP